MRFGLGILQTYGIVARVRTDTLITTQSTKKLQYFLRGQKYYSVIWYNKSTV